MDLVITGPSDDYVKPNQDPSDRPSAYHLMYIDLPKVFKFGNFHVNKNFVWSGVLILFQVKREETLACAQGPSHRPR